MYIHHIALWTTQLEELRQFYITYFNGTSNEKYVNPAKGFESYLISFDGGGALIEMMRKTDVTSPADKIPHIGLAHLSAGEVKKLFSNLQNAYATMGL